MGSGDLDLGEGGGGVERRLGYSDSHIHDVFGRLRTSYGGIDMFQIVCVH